MNLKPLTDKDLIVFLTATGIPIKDIKREQNKNKSLVYFEDNKDLEDAIINFVNRKGEINICDFLAAEKRVKTLLCLQKA